MNSSRRTLAGAVGLVLAVTALLVLTGCSGSECGAGRDSAEAVVEDFLLATAEADDESGVCAFAAEENKGAAWDLAQSLKPAVEAAGGAGALDLRVDDARRMGATHVVVAAVGDRLVHEFVVEETDGTFLLLPEMNAP